jgi:hypothetical protein
VSGTASLDNLGFLGVTLPPAPMDSTDRNVFPGRAATLWRDPLATNTAIPFENVNIKLSVNMDKYWDQMGRCERAIRRGPINCAVVVRGKPGDEYWRMALDSNANPNGNQAYRLILPEPVSGHTFTMTLYNLMFDVPPIGLRDKEYDPIVAEGMCTIDAAGNFVGITLT